MISLVMATFGRKDEISQFMDSLELQTNKNFELIIVDQNPSGYLDSILKPNRSYIFKHILSDKMGLSYNRNIGIKNSIGNYLAFPDDDCLYYPNTIEIALSKLTDSNINMVIGRIWDRDNSSNIIKKWPKYEFLAKRSDLYAISSSITFFYRNYGQTFNELLGAGSTYPSNEDFHFIASTFEIKSGILYSPSLEVWHPKQSYMNVTQEKAYQYGRGFGFCAKLLTGSSYYYAFLFIQAIGFHFSNCIISAISLNFNKTRYSYSALCGRLRGWRDTSN